MADAFDPNAPLPGPGGGGDWLDALAQSMGVSKDDLLQSMSAPGQMAAINQRILRAQEQMNAPSPQGISHGGVFVAPSLLGTVGALGQRFKGSRALKAAEKEQQGLAPQLARAPLLKMAMEARQREQQYGREQASEELKAKRARELEEFKAGAAMDRAKVKAGSQSSGPKAAADLRKEFNSLPVVKKTQEVAEANAKIQTSSPTGPGDISLLVAFMKMIDPGSTVRENEFATAENAGGVPSQVRNIYNRLVTGEKLPDYMRGQFRNEASSLLDAQLKNYNATAGNYRRLAESIGASPSDVVLELGYGRGQAKKAAPAEEPKESKRETYPRKIIKGKTYEQRPDGWYEVE